jgi:hypothetical protein
MSELGKGMVGDRPRGSPYFLLAGEPVENALIVSSLYQEENIYLVNFTMNNE